MDFMNAVKLMKEGKKVILNEDNLWYLILETTLFVFKSKVTGRDWHTQNLTLSEYESDNWEEYKKEDDWSLNNKCFEEKAGYHFGLDDIKKLKQKILEDIQSLCVANHYPKHYFDGILNKRFGL